MLTPTINVTPKMIAKTVRAFRSLRLGMLRKAIDVKDKAYPSKKRAPETSASYANTSGRKLY